MPVAVLPRLRPFAASLLLLAAAAGAPAPDGCTPGPVDGSPLTYCMLLEPTGDVEGARGEVWLEPFDGPFGVAVDRDGQSRQQLRVVVAGLPAPQTLGATHYVAWATTPLLAPVLRLGTISNGTQRVGPVPFSKFVVIISAESDPAVTGWSRQVLRGFSPNATLMPHGSSALPARRPAEAHGGHQHGAAAEGGTGWPMPPMHPNVPTMVPGLETLTPATTPWALPVPSSRAVTPTRLRLPARGTVLDAAPVQRAVDGLTYGGYAFNRGRIGPQLEAMEGDAADVTVRNALGEATGVHWHGLRHDWRQDGAVGLSQPADPTGTARRYRLRFPDPGLFWYHSHHREDRQIDLGLAGTILVHPKDSAWLPPVTGEQVLLLDDLLVGDGAVFPHGATTATHALMGRMGNRLLLNGEPAHRVTAVAGAPLRLWFANAANARIFNVSIDGHPLKLVAGDMGRLSADHWTDGIVIAPGERWGADVQPAAPGRYAITNRIVALNGWAGAYFAQVDTLGWLDVAPAAAQPRLAEARAAFPALQSRPDVQAQFGDLAAELARPADHELLLTLRLDSLPFSLIQAMRLDTAYVHPVEWTSTMPMMDVLTTAAQVHWTLRDVATGAENHAIAWRMPVGARRKIRLRNDRHTLHAMQHPIHLHGQRFLVLSRNGVPNAAPVWKDTAIVPAGAVVDLLVEFSTPGQWMLHCHIAEHLASGMHTVITVE